MWSWCTGELMLTYGHTPVIHNCHCDHVTSICVSSTAIFGKYTTTFSPKWAGRELGWLNIKHETLVLMSILCLYLFYFNFLLHFHLCFCFYFFLYSNVTYLKPPRVIQPSLLLVLSSHGGRSSREIHHFGEDCL